MFFLPNSTQTVYTVETVPSPDCQASRVMTDPLATLDMSMLSRESQASRDTLLAIHQSGI
jgi:hypothetical protein